MEPKKKRVHAVRAISHADKVPKVIEVRVNDGGGIRYDAKTWRVVLRPCRWVRNGWAVHEMYLHEMWARENQEKAGRENPYLHERWMVTHVDTGLAVNHGYAMVREADNVGMRMALLLPNRSRDEMEAGGEYFLTCWRQLIQGINVPDVFVDEDEVQVPFDKNGYRECLKRRL